MAQDEFRKVRALVLEFALGLPDAHEDHPWGETVVKVAKKVFVFLGKGAGGFGLSVKLPDSGKEALELPFTQPTGYGLGKSGWVSASFAAGELPPVDLLLSWVDESYRAIAPKRLVARLAAGREEPPAAARRTQPVDKKKKKKKAAPGRATKRRSSRR